MLTGKKLYDGDSSVVIMFKHAYDVVPDRPRSTGYAAGPLGCPDPHAAEGSVEAVATTEEALPPCAA